MRVWEIQAPDSAVSSSKLMSYFLKHEEIELEIICKYGDQQQSYTIFCVKRTEPDAH